MAVRSRARALVPFALAALAALAACGGKSGPEDPAIAVGTGIPMGAPNATGVRFDALPVAHGSPIEEGDVEPPPTPKPLPKAVPDPFDPLDTPHGPKAPLDPPPKPTKPPKKGVQL